MVELSVYARLDLVDPARPLESPALLLEGSWPNPRLAGARWSLDDALDGSFQWIDQQAAAWSELLGPLPDRNDQGRALVDQVSPAFLHALALRYYLVKLLRPLAFLTEVQPLRSRDRVELVVSGDADEDYAELLGQLCAAVGARFRLRRLPAVPPRAAALPPNPPWRRWASRMAHRLRGAPSPDRLDRRVVLCGNPALLDPVCRELLQRGCGVWWLYDRFALRSWLRWQRRGAGQLVCDSSLGQENRLRDPLAGLPQRLAYAGVNLMPALGRWLSERAAAFGHRHTRLLEQLDLHFTRVRPEALVLDEDATPMARAATAAARRHGARSLVVQHGIPASRFGFAPLAADRILVWGRSSAEQLVRWGVPAEQIRITGWPRAVAARTDGRRASAEKCILLLDTVPPRANRPDVLAGHFTRASYRQMLRAAMACACAIPGARLVVKRHPRAPDDPLLPAVVAEFPALRVQIVRRQSLDQCLARAQAVISCGSTAGVEASLAGVPVIGLLPSGGTFWMPDDQWGLSGVARNETNLQRLLAQALETETLSARRPPVAAASTRTVPLSWTRESGHSPVVEAFGPDAAARVVDEVLIRPMPQHIEPRAA